VREQDDLDLTRVVTASTAGDAASRAGAWGRFPPGTLFAGRFRIVAPLGRGGMGEVYRADDLKLDQTVALKFLPEEVAADPARLAQFHNEVRVARTIAHRNVCRMYDIGDADGRPFLTMEYVDGEDLASLLHRIGRFPQDRAIEVARQMCAGVAAAHERGVLHRDLKPANIMIDGDGHVRITDFGLAAAAETAVDNVRVGTPAYMAPEQLAGREVTARSDLYALGLVLFELFTGKRAFEATTINELRRAHESSAVSSPSSVVRDLDPTIERAILRCLDIDPLRRPPSALAIAAALPGGDQLAAALAAGETPSPEMVAAAGGRSALQPAVGLTLVGFTVVMLAVLTAISQHFATVHRVPLPKSIDALADRAQELIERLGYTDPPFDSASGWTLNREYMNYAARQRLGDPAAALATGRTGTLTFWYRTSPSAIVPIADNLLPSPVDPPFTLSGMRIVRYDTQGRLLEFDAMTPQIDDAARSRVGDVNWTPLFEAAGLAPDTLHAVDPRWMPRAQADRRAAWEGPLPGMDSLTVRVEAAAYRGKAIFFAVIAPWTEPQRMVRSASSSTDRIVSVLATLVGALILVGAALLARRHLRSGRGDRRGAFRTAAVLFACETSGWIVYARHYGDVQIEMFRLNMIVAFTLLAAGTLWIFYLALEPYVRRFWPELLIGWTRLLSGQFRDPLVGRDVLAGVAAGTIGALLLVAPDFVPRLLGWPVSFPLLPNPALLLGPRYAFATTLNVVRSALTDALQATCILVFFRVIVRRTWLAMTLAAIVLLPIAMTGSFSGEHLGFDITIALAGIALVFGVLIRFGLLALIVTFYSFLTLWQFPLTTDLSRPYAPSAGMVVVVFAALAALAFWASRGGEAVLGRALLD
jgi:serine/threonine-protein kinase